MSHRRFTTIVPDNQTRKVDHVITELRARGVSYRAISHGFQVFTGIQLTPGHVKIRAAKLGLERDHRRGGFRA
jgi:hypothetical protein